MDEFDPSIKAATNYVERAQIYFEANDIAEAKKVSTFQSAIGKKTSVVLRDFVSLDNPKDKTRDQLVEVLKQHYKPVYVSDCRMVHLPSSLSATRRVCCRVRGRAQQNESEL